MKNFIKYLGLIGISFAVILSVALANSKVKLNMITLDTSNTISLVGEVNSESTSAVAAAILSSTADPIYLYIKSPGGSVIDGLRLSSVIKNSNKNIICIADVAISMAFALVQYCDQRTVLENGIMMQHVASFGVEHMPAPNANSFVKFINKVTEKLTEEQAERMKMTVPSFKAAIRDDWWMVGMDAVNNNAADRVVNVVCTPVLLKLERKERVRTMFGTVDLVFYACPLIDAPKSINFPQKFQAPQKQEFEDTLDIRKNVEKMTKK